MTIAHFPAHELERVAAAVKKAEQNTSGEIVPVILPSSQDYSWLPWVVGFRVALVSLVSLELFSLLTWPLPWGRTLTIVVVATSLGVALSFVPAIARRLIGKKRLGAGVLDRTRSLFISEGVTETKDRTGVLVLISKFEHEISILADQGIHSKVPQAFWNDLCREFVGSVREHHEIDGLCRLVEKIGAELAKHFPRSPDDRNELEDHLRGRS